MANIGTSTVAYATGLPSNSAVFIASDGAACVLWCDGTNNVISYEDSSYSVWTKATLVTGLNFVATGEMDAATGNIYSVTGATTTVRPNWRLLTKSGATWTVGTANVISTTAAGTAGQANVANYAIDPYARHWLICGTSAYTTARTLFCNANLPTGSWGGSLSVAQTSDQFFPIGDVVGNYVVVIYFASAAMKYQRADVSGSAVGSYSAVTTIPNLGGTTDNVYRHALKSIGGTKAAFVYSSYSGIYAQTYDSSIDTWSANVQLSTNANDRTPTIATDGAGNAWAIWCAYSAANNFSLVYKKYNGSTWDSSPTTLVASGTNISNPNAGYGNSTVGVMYTQGTGSPYTIGWTSFGTAVAPTTYTRPITGISASVGVTYTRPIIGVSAATQALDIKRNITGVSSATKALDIKKPISGVSAATQALGITRPTTGSVSVSLSALTTSTRPITSVSAATQALDIKKPISGVSVAVAVSTTTYTRPITGVSTATQALGITRPIAGVSAAVGDTSHLLIASDNYTRANTASGWGTSTNTDGVTNYAWGLDGTGVGVKITSNRGTSNNAATDYTAILDDGTSRTLAEVLYKFSVSLAAANVRGVIRHNGGGTSGTDSYRAGYSNGTMEIRSRRASTSTVRATTAFTATLSQDYWIRFQVVTSGGGNPLCNLRWWTDGASEPSTWGLSWEDTTGNPVPAGAMGFQFNASSTATSMSIGQYRAYDLSAPAGATTYTRPITGVSAALQALSISRNLVSISSATKALGITKTISGVSGAFVQTSGRDIGARYGSSHYGAARYGASISVALSSLVTSTRPITGVSTALLALGVPRNMTGVSVAIQALGLTRPIVSVSSATKALDVKRTLLGVSGSVGQAGITRPITGVSVALQALGIPRPLVSVSAATLQPGIAKNITGVSVSASVAYSRTITGVSFATLQPGITRTLVGISTSLSVTYSRSVSGVSSAVQAFGVSRNITGINAAVGVAGLARTIIGVSVATKQLGATRPIAGISGATIQIGITRPLVGLSTSVVLTATRPVSGVSTALKALRVERSLVGVSTATKAFGVTRPLIGVTGAVGQGGISRTIINVSVALQALGIARNSTSVSSALQALGVTRSLVGVSGALSQIGITRDISGVSVALVQTVSRTLTPISGAVQATVSRSVSGVSSSIALRSTRPLTSVSSAVKAFGVARPITGILGAIGVAGITRPLMGISASVYFEGKMYTYITVVGARGNITTEGTRGNITALGTRGTITVQED